LGPVKSVFGSEVSLDAAVIKHVLKRHPELKKLRDVKGSILLTIASPNFVFMGRYGENIAARRIEAGVFEGKWMMVPYEEYGMVKTAFIASKVEKILKRGILWKRE
jgi:hypothetical protein